MKIERKIPQSTRLRATQGFPLSLTSSREKYWQHACAAKPDRPACKIYEN